MLTPEQRHRHSGLASDGDKIKYKDLEGIPQFAKVATSGSYNDLTDLPTTDAKKYCFATFSGTNTTVSATSKTIDLTSFETNDSGMSVTNNRITITKDGQYLVTGMIQFVFNGTGSREGYVRINGGSIFADVYSAPNPNDVTSIVITVMKTFVAGDYIDMRAYQTSGGNLNVNGGAGRTYLQVCEL